MGSEMCIRDSHIDASHSRQPLVKGERLVRYEVNAVMVCVSNGTSCGTILCAQVLIGQPARFVTPQGYAAPGVVRCQCNMRASLSKLKKMAPRRKIVVTSKSPVGDISVVTLIRTDTTLDHSQKAEKVCTVTCEKCHPNAVRATVSYTHLRAQETSLHSV